MVKQKNLFRFVCVLFFGICLYASHHFKCVIIIKCVLYNLFLLRTLYLNYCWSKFCSLEIYVHWINTSIFFSFPTFHLSCVHVYACFVVFNYTLTAADRPATLFVFILNETDKNKIIWNMKGMRTNLCCPDIFCFLYFQYVHILKNVYRCVLSCLVSATIEITEWKKTVWARK